MKPPLRSDGLTPSRDDRTIRPHLRRLAGPAAALIAGGMLLLIAVLSGLVQNSNATLVAMGFDPDRAQLISALLVGAAGAAVATLVWDHVKLGVVLGTLTFAALFGQTFEAETTGALSSSGALGVFDASGWVLTALSLISVSAICAWSGATLAFALRPHLLGAGAALAEMIHTRRVSRRSASRPSGVVLIILLLALTVPAFGELLNVSPDALMLRGGNFVPLAPGDSVPVPKSAIPDPTPDEAPSVLPSVAPSVLPAPSLTASPSPSPSPTPQASPGSKPWLAWKPSGAGKVTKVDFPAPWIDGTAGTDDVNIYTPAGYDPAGTRHYPVLYEAPTGLTLWNQGTSTIGALDQLIADGSIPAVIVVYINSSGATYADSQCANSSDNRMWLETFISETIVHYVDDNYLTIPEPNARGIMGMSAGGFCAAMLLVRHPDVYSSAISFSGYFYAGIGSSSAHLPYGTQADMDAASPALLVPALSGEVQARLYFIIDAAATQGFYGPQAQNFEKILAANDVGFDAIKSGWLHGWTQVRQDFPAAVEAWSARLVVNGLW